MRIERALSHKKRLLQLLLPDATQDELTTHTHTQCNSSSTTSTITDEHQYIEEKTWKKRGDILFFSSSPVHLRVRVLRKRGSSCSCVLNFALSHLICALSTPHRRRLQRPESLDVFFCKEHTPIFPLFFFRMHGRYYYTTTSAHNSSSPW